MFVKARVINQYDPQYSKVAFVNVSMAQYIVDHESKTMMVDREGNHSEVDMSFEDFTKILTEKGLAL